jgi:hypothetical protein
VLPENCKQINKLRKEIFLSSLCSLVLQNQYNVLMLLYLYQVKMSGILLNANQRRLYENGVSLLFLPAWMICSTVT